jgi:hypothetical protein
MGMTGAFMGSDLSQGTVGGTYSAYMFCQNYSTGLNYLLTI